MWKSTILLIFRGYFGVVRTCPVTGPPFSLQFFLLKVRRRWWEEKMLELIIWLRRKSWGSNTSRRKWKREKIREGKRILWSEWRLYLPKLEWSILRVLGGLPTSKLFLFLFRISFSHSFFIFEMIKKILQSPQTSDEENWASLPSGHIWRNREKYQRSSPKFEKPWLFPIRQHRSGHIAGSISRNLPGDLETESKARNTRKQNSI